MPAKDRRRDHERDWRGDGGTLSADDTILDLLNHPAFAGFGRLLLPWDGHTYDDSMRLRDVGSLLPYTATWTPAQWSAR